ncbi:iron uptake transporter permease EfeU [Pantoea sp. Aalb]|uniref:iron uptake transporter permease EfeU n=1 Tax=Pantoea sp. Aalb TaxID=2576762 RepID=UPI001324DCEE|nr:iron uptake transporter permease EfeU [Pantoea sp. Aalb]MXP67343.1 iron permease [Pantoea sp. Aalb]
MFLSFLIMLREGFEAALIVSLIASYLKRIKRIHLFPAMWAGVFIAVILCLVLGIIISKTTGEFPQKQQELFEGIVAIVAVIILTSMVFWMRKISINIKLTLETSVDQVLQKQSSNELALILMVFLAVAREGLESVFFLLTSFTQDVGYAPPIGAILGLTTSILLGFLIYYGSIKLNVAHFFYWTSFFILFVTAGIASSAIRALHEAGLWNFFQKTAFDLSNVLSTHSIFGILLETLIGYQESPSVSEVAMWFIYLIPTLFFFLSIHRPIFKLIK